MVARVVNKSVVREHDALGIASAPVVVDVAFVPRAALGVGQLAVIVVEHAAAYGLARAHGLQVALARHPTSLASLDLAYEVAALFKMFGDKTRVMIMQVLHHNELNVCEISYLLNMTHSAISHQLATLKMVNLVKSRKSGKEVYYSLADDHVKSIIALGKEHIQEG